MNLKRLFATAIALLTPAAAHAQSHLAIQPQAQAMVATQTRQTTPQRALASLAKQFPQTELRKVSPATNPFLLQKLSIDAELHEQRQYEEPSISRVSLQRDDRMRIRRALSHARRSTST